MKRSFEIITLLLLIAFCFTMLPIGSSAAQSDGQTAVTVSAAEGDASLGDKTEVIYGTLGTDGGLQSLYAVNHFEFDEGGSFSDAGDYSSVINLTNTFPLTLENGAVSGYAEAGSFYYQGNINSARLPWIISLTYKLDGNDIEADELAGKSGRLEMSIKSMPDTQITDVFYQNYMLQITVNLLVGKAGGINAPSATLAEAGGSRMLTYTVMPGKNADFKITADITDFEMDGIDIAAMPFSMNIETPDTGEFIGQFESLADAISLLCDGVTSLKNGATDLSSGAGGLSDGSSGILSGLTELGINSAALTDASAQINASLSMIAQSFGSAEVSGDGMDDIALLPAGLTELSGGLRQICGGLNEYKTGFSQAHTALDAAISQIPAVVLSEYEIGALYAGTNAANIGTLNILTSSYTAAQAVRLTYSQVKAAFDAAVPTLEGVTGGIETSAAALDQMAAAIKDALENTDTATQLEQLGMLSSGLADLASGYTAFDGGLRQYTAGVLRLADGYADFDSGLNKYKNGISEYSNGIGELESGTRTLQEETSDMPETAKNEIDKMMDEYLGGDFKPVSFTSPENAGTSLVQFVLKCGGIKIQKPEPVPETPEKVSFFDRLAALFK